MSVKPIILLVLISNSFGFGFEKSNSFNTFQVLRIDDSFEQGLIEQQSIKTVNDDDENVIENALDENISKILDLGDKPKNLPTKQNLHRSSVKFLYTIYRMLSQENADPDNVPLTDNTIRHKRSISNFVTNFDLMEIEKCNNVISFSPKKTRQFYGNKRNKFQLLFNINDIPKTFQLQRSELRIYKNASIDIASLHDLIQIVISVHLAGSNEDKIIPLATMNMNLNYVGWLEFDITVAVRKLILNRRYSPTLQIIIQLVDDLSFIMNPSDIGLISSEYYNEEFHPFLIGFFKGPEIIDNIKVLKRTEKKPKNNRLKRNAGKPVNQKKKKTEAQNDNVKDKNYRRPPPPPQFSGPKYCQRMNFTVNFVDLNWQNWIIAPEKFDAYFCSGECNFPLGAAMNATNHALVQTLMHLKRPWIPKPCCAPKNLGSISVLYHLNKDSVNLRKYKHMVAYDCGCH